MVTAFWILLVVAHLGALDVLVFHAWQAKVPFRASSRTEARLHAVRHIAYGLQFLWIAHLQWHGWALLLLLPLYVVDVLAAWTDVWVENDSRAEVGGLQRGEYLLHIILSFLVGGYAMAVAQAATGWWHEPTAILWAAPAVPELARTYMTVMGASAIGLGLWDFMPDHWLAFLALDRKRLGEHVPSPMPLKTPKRIVTEVVLKANAQDVWDRTIDAANHVQWDLRFDEIQYLSQPSADDETRELLYITRIVPGIAIQGTGSYRNTDHLRSSAFRFDSDDPKSFMHNGKGVWTYMPQDDGTLLFRSVYDYDARFGWPGAWFDHLMFRPLLSLATEWSFETLRRWLDEPGFAPASRSDRASFVRFAIPRLLGAALPKLPFARGWVGSGTLEERRELV